jgi:hypothetical protein
MPMDLKEMDQRSAKVVSHFVLYSRPNSDEGDSSKVDLSVQNFGYKSSFNTDFKAKSPQNSRRTTPKYR